MNGVTGKLRQKGEMLRALGAMSGTSLDGVDAAVLETDGAVIKGFGPSEYLPYTDAQRQVLLAALGHWNSDRLPPATDVVMDAHRVLLGRFAQVDLIGFHGQTVAHAPRVQGTLQLGDGAALADSFAVPVVWDFRTADIELGGEGAPLAPFFHFACAKWIGAQTPLAFLNLGGVGNITWVDPRFDRPEAPGALLAFDTGPANAPVNDLVQARFGVPFDAGGKIAGQGTVKTGALELFLADAYFSKMPPKSLDRNDFSEMVELVAELGDADAAATLTAMCAAAVAAGMAHCPAPPGRVLVTGGGRHNRVLMQMLAVSLECPIAP